MEQDNVWTANSIYQCIVGGTKVVRLDPNEKKRWGTDEDPLAPEPKVEDDQDDDVW